MSISLHLTYWQTDRKEANHWQSLQQPQVAGKAAEGTTEGGVGNAGATAVKVPEVPAGLTSFPNGYLGSSWSRSMSSFTLSNDFSKAHKLSASSATIYCLISSIQCHGEGVSPIGCSMLRGTSCESEIPPLRGCQSAGYALSQGAARIEQRMTHDKVKRP
jgi:hypothetical protein